MMRRLVGGHLEAEETLQVRLPAPGARPGIHTVPNQDALHILA